VKGRSTVEDRQPRSLFCRRTCKSARRLAYGSRWNSTEVCACQLHPTATNSHQQGTPVQLRLMNTTDATYHIRQDMLVPHRQRIDRALSHRRRASVHNGTTPWPAGGPGAQGREGKGLRRHRLVDDSEQRRQRGQLLTACKTDTRSGDLRADSSE